MDDITNGIDNKIDKADTELSIDMYEQHSLANRGQRITYTTMDMYAIAEEYLDECVYNANVPTIEGFVIKLKVSPGSWHKARQNSVALIELTDYIMLHQREALIQGGLKAKNPRFHEFMMRAVHKVFDIPDEVREINKRALLDNPDVLDKLDRIERKLRDNTDRQKARYVDVSGFEVSSDK